MYITLNDKRIEIKGEIAEKQQAPWAAKIGSGTTEFGNFLPCDIKEWRDLRGGIGLESEEKPSNRLYWSEGVETSKEGYIVPGPYIETAGALGAAPIKFADYNGTGASLVYVIADDICSVWNPAGTPAWDDTDDGTALSDPTDMIVATDATDTYLITCNGVSMRYTANGTAWGAHPSTQAIKYMAMFDKRLIGIDAGYKKLWYSPRENIDGTLASFNLSGDYSVVTKLFTGKLLTGLGEPTIYMQTDTGLFVIDFYTQTCYKMEVRYPATTNARAGMYWNSYLFIGTGSGIRRITPNLNSPWGPDQDDGLPADFQGYIYDMLGTSHWVVACVAGGTKDSILKRHESLGGWHQVYSSTSAIECIHWSPIYSPGRLWFGDGAAVKYIQFPDKTHDITKVSGYKYCAAGTLYLPRMSSVSIVPKVALKVEALTKDLVAANETLTPSYIVNDDISMTGGDWTALGAFTVDPRPSSAFNSSLGISFYDIALKIVFASGATDKAAKIKTIGLYYLTLPPAVSAWQFTVKALGDRAKEVITNLETARDSTVLVNFSPDGDLNKSEKYVRIMSMPSKRWLDANAAEKVFNVVVTEVS